MLAYNKIYTVSVSSGAYQDEAGNMTSAFSLGSFTTRAASAAPEVDRTSLIINAASGGTGSFNVSLGVGATAAAKATIASSNIDVVTPDVSVLTTDGAVTVNRVSDGNTNITVTFLDSSDTVIGTATVAVSVTVDTSVPTVTISSSAGPVTNLASIPVTIKFSESVTGLTVSSITVTNGTVDALSGSGITYTLNVAPKNIGTVIVQVPAGVAQDDAGNYNDAGQLILSYDGTMPTARLLSPTGLSVSVSTSNIVLGFSKTVTATVGKSVTVNDGTDNYDYIIGSGSEYLSGADSSCIAAIPVSSFKRGGNSLSLTYNKIYTVSVSSGAYQDEAGNMTSAGSLGTFGNFDTEVSTGRTSTETAPSVSDASLSLYEGKTGGFTINMGSGSARATSAVITSDNTAVAVASPSTVTESKAISITALSSGTAKITVQFNDRASTKRVIAVIVSDGGIDTKLITMPYSLADGRDPNKLVAFYTNEADQRVIVPYCVYDSAIHTMKIRAQKSNVFEIVYNDVSFSDVSGWYKEYVDFLSSRKIINGDGSGAFSPNDNITRAQLVMILKNLSGDDTHYSSSAFTDVNSSSWYFDAVQWAYSNGIVYGYEGKFNPDSQISRQDIAVMIARYTKNVENYTIPTAVNALSFTDSTKIAAYASDIVYSMQQAGILTGYSDGSFAPLNSATRAEAAKILTVLIKQMVE